MRIKIEDYNGNDLCEFNITYLTSPSRLTDLENCSIADIDTDEYGIFARIQLET